MYSIQSTHVHPYSILLLHFRQIFSLHISIVETENNTYRIAGNFRGRKLSQISRFWSYLWNLSQQNWGHGVFWQQHQWTIHESFLHENLIFHQFTKVFSLKSFLLYGTSHRRTHRYNKLHATYVADPHTHTAEPRAWILEGSPVFASGTESPPAMVMVENKHETMVTKLIQTQNNNTCYYYCCFWKCVCVRVCEWGKGRLTLTMLPKRCFFKISKILPLFTTGYTTW